jgi:hypothetical protein
VNQNYFPEPNRHILTFLHPILLCRITYWASLEMHHCHSFRFGCHGFTAHLWRCTIAIVLGRLPRFYRPSLILLLIGPSR